MAQAIAIVPMAEFKHRRGEDSDNDVVTHLRATDTVISGLQRWGTFVLVLIGFGVQIGVTFTKFGSMQENFTELRRDVTDYKKETNKIVDVLSKENLLLRRDMDTLTDKNKSLEGQVVELRGQINLMRSMREAYVYDSAKEAKRVLLNKAVTPP